MPKVNSLQVKNKVSRAMTKRIMEDVYSASALPYLCIQIIASAFLTWKKNSPCSAFASNVVLRRA